MVVGNDVLGLVLGSRQIWVESRDKDTIESVRMVGHNIS